MKKIILLFCFVAMTLFGYSQVKVVSTGESIVGPNAGVTPSEQLHVVGRVFNEGQNVEKTGSSATTLFNRTDFAAMLIGAGGNAGFTFDEDFNFEIRSRDRANILARRLSQGQRYLIGKGTTGFIGIGATANPSEQLHVSGNIFASGMITPSDKRLKNNVVESKLGLAELNQMNIIEYNYNGKSGLKTDKTHVGVFAQELQKIAPSLVTNYIHQIEDDENNVVKEEEYLAINDSAIKWLIVSAIQEQQEMIESQNAKIEELENLISNVGSVENINNTNITLSTYDLAELDQNTPNPFNGQTTIAYVIPSDAQNAQISVYGQSGQLMKTLDIEHVGQGTLTVNASDLPSGTYSYQLIVDGRNIQTNMMVVAK